MELDKIGRKRAKMRMDRQGWRKEKVEREQKGKREVKRKGREDAMQTRIGLERNK